MNLRYKVWNGEMEIVEVLDDNFYCPGATKPCMWGRYLKTRDKFLTSLASYPHKTPKDAWSEYIKDLENTIENNKLKLNELLEERDKLIKEVCKANIEMVKLT